MDKQNTHFTEFLPSPLREHARIAIAARHLRKASVDPDLDLDDPIVLGRRLAAIDLVSSLIDDFGAADVASWVRYLAAQKGQAI